MRNKAPPSKRWAVRGSRVRAVCQEMLEFSLGHEEFLQRLKPKRSKAAEIRAFAMRRRRIAKQIESLYVELSGNPPDQFGMRDERRAKILVQAVDRLMRAGI